MQVLVPCGISGGTTTLRSVGVGLITVCRFFVRAFISTVADELCVASWSRAQSSLRGLCHLLIICSVPLLGLLLSHVSVPLISKIPPIGSSGSQAVSPSISMFVTLHSTFAFAS